MARPSELTQALINDAADQLKAQGRKPSPNAVRDIVKTGSFSTIKQMLDTWLAQQEQEENIPVPEMPDFAHRLLEKLHRTLYLHNHKALDGERQLLAATEQESETERKEMLAEITKLEDKNAALAQSLADSQATLHQTAAKLAETQRKFDQVADKVTQQQLEIATLVEREKQRQTQMKEKNDQLQQAEKREASLQQTIAAFSNKE